MGLGLLNLDQATDFAIVEGETEMFPLGAICALANWFRLQSGVALAVKSVPHHDFRSCENRPKPRKNAHEL
jgi:hypothetical protein